MSIEQEITRINNNISDALSAVEEQGGTVKGGANSDSLAQSILSIPASSVEIAQKKGDSETAVMSQKVVTKELNQLSQEIGDLKDENYVKTVNGIAPDENGNVTVTAQAEQPTFVDSVEEMTDTTKAYVLSSTGEIWTYQKKTTTTVTEGENKFVPSEATLNKRLSGSSGSISDNATSVGTFITGFIPVTNWDETKPYYVDFNYEVPTFNDGKFILFDSSKTRIISSECGLSSIESFLNTIVGNGKTSIDIKKTKTNADITNTGVAYVRFQLAVNNTQTAITTADIQNITAKFRHESVTTTETTSKFYSTGLTYNASDYEPRIVALEGDVDVLKQQVENLEGGETEVIIPTWWEDAVNECIAKIKALQSGGNTVTFPFFADNHQRNGYAGVLIKKVMDECNIPYCFYGGDSIGSGYIETEEAMLEQDKKFDSMMKAIPNGRFCRTVGNHDGLWKQSNGTANQYTREQIYELFLREESISQRKHFGGDGTYYYIDDISSRTRFIVLNTNKIKGDTQTFDSAQLEWLKNTALNFNEDGWEIVFISHQPISNHYHALIDNAEEVVAVVDNYINGTTEHKADVVGWWSGHIHRDRSYTGMAVNTTDDSVGTPLPFTQVTIISDHVAVGYGGVSHAVDNSDQSHAIDFVTINKDTRTVNITRLGFGEDRSFTYKKSPLPYTVVPETTVKVADYDATVGYETETTFMFDLNKSYKVVWNGVEYVFDEVLDMSDENDLIYIIGNTAMLGLEDNGVPFIIGTGESEVMRFLTILDWLYNSGQSDEPTDFTFSIAEVIEEDLPIYKCSIETETIAGESAELLKGVSFTTLKRKQRIIELDGKLYTSEYFTHENGGVINHEILLTRTYPSDALNYVNTLYKETILFKYVPQYKVIGKVISQIAKSSWTLVSS